MITSDSARWAGVEISFNFSRWRLRFDMVGQRTVFPEKDAMRAARPVLSATQLKVERWSRPVFLLRSARARRESVTNLANDAFTARQHM